MLSKLQRWIAGSAEAAPGRPRLGAETWPAVVYAIGDIHGCLEEFETLERLILDDAKAVAGEKWIITLGDYVDRGPDSARVLEKLIAPAPEGFERISLCGNHEAMMLDYVDNPVGEGPWLDYGGVETLLSYGIKARDLLMLPKPERKVVLSSHIPAAHLNWMRKLPSMLSLPGTVFVHAGLRPGMALENQAEKDLIWIREPFLSASQLPVDRVVHGHTPGPEPVVTPVRIDVDTGAFASGRLTAVRLTGDGAFSFIDTSLGGRA